MTEPKDVGRILRAIDAVPATYTISCALKIVPYVFVRPGELREARWTDIDFATREWRYTANKTETQHIVPLCKYVVSILKGLHELTGDGEYVFSGHRKNGRPIKRESIRQAMLRSGIGREETTIHGFRATARTLLDEILGERYDLIEHQLAHTVRDPNGRAYN